VKTLKERLRESLRLTILTLLGGLENRRIDERTLRMALRDMDRETARDVLFGELLWMERQGLVTLKGEDTALMTATLTERGDLCQRGETAEPGVARPDLG
jgi:hypothetical protein